MSAINMCFEKPLISVLMGVRYHRKDLFLLKRSVCSVLEQTYPNLEFLICENDSTPEACQYLQRMKLADNRIHLVDGQHADTLSAKLNRCIQVAKGEYFARQDDDDWSSPQRIEVQWEYLCMNPEIAFVGCVARLEQSRTDVGICQLPEKPCVKDFYITQPFLHPTLLFRRDVFSFCGVYCEEERCSGCEDYDLLLRIYEAGFFGANIQTPYFAYTLAPARTSNRNLKMRFNELVTRFIRFQSLGLLPGALPYIIKPILVGLMPQSCLEKIKERRIKRG